MNFSVTATIFISGSVSLLLMPLLIKLFSKKNIVDRIDSRKVHKYNIPTMGGMGIFFAFILTVLLLGSFDQIAAHRLELFTLALMFVVGLRDDLIEFKPISKLIAQIIPAILLISLGDFVILSFYNFLGIQEIPYWFGVILTIVLVIGLTNSYNLIDGLDGLASSFALIASIIFGIWFYIQDIQFYSFLAFAFSGALIGFLYFNWQPAKIFMGDTGALIIGFLFSILVVRFINFNDALPSGTFLKFNSGIGMGLSVLFIPVIDTLRVIIVRLLSKKSPLNADKNHIHHVLLRKGLNHGQVTIVLVTLNIIIVALAYLLDFWGANIVVFALILLGIVLGIVLKYLNNDSKVIENNASR
ncbi:MAG: MraY family glycosyltransferase [Bacteroidota bacterium]